MIATGAAPRVVIPHTPNTLYLPLVRLVLDADGLNPEPVEVEPRFGMSAAYVEWWAAARTTVVVEDDIIPWPGAVAWLLRCPKPLCGYEYRQRGQYGWATGCTKFDASIMQKHPQLAARARARPAHPHRSGSFQVFESTLFAELQAAGYDMHVHKPGVAHLNPRQTRKEVRYW